MRKAARKTLLLCMVMAMIVGSITTVLAEDEKILLPYQDEGNNSFTLCSDEELLIIRQGKDKSSGSELYGVIAVDGTIVVPLGKYDYIQDYSDGLAAVKDEKGLWGYIDTDGTLVIPHKYKFCSPFSEGHAIVSTYPDGVFQVIDKNEDVTGTMHFMNASFFKIDEATISNSLEYTFFSEGVCLIHYGYFQGERSCVLIDTNGNLIKYFSWLIDDINEFHNGRLLVKYKTRYGYDDLEGNHVIPKKYYNAAHFSEGVAIVTGYGGEGFGGGSFNTYYINPAGNVLATNPFSRSWIFNQGYSVGEYEGQTVVIDRQFKNVSTINYIPKSGYRDGYINVQDSSNKIGTVDINGNLVVPCIFDSVLGQPAGGYMVGKIDSKYYSVPAKKPKGIPKMAIPTFSRVLVDGTEIEFDAYNIDQNNYFKLRDIAYVVSGTDSQFEIFWDSRKSEISLISGKSYTAAGGELAKGLAIANQASLCTSAINKDGNAIDLTGYTINGNNYFKLRDLGAAFGFGVTWDGENDTILIDSAPAVTELPTN